MLKVIERTFQVDPNIIRVEDFELADYTAVSLTLIGSEENIAHTRLELLDVFRRNLGDLKQTDLTIVVDNSTTLVWWTLRAPDVA
jgi:hypothetical protein